MSLRPITCAQNPREYRPRTAAAGHAGRCSPGGLESPPSSFPHSPARTPRPALCRPALFRGRPVTAPVPAAASSPTYGKLKTGTWREAPTVPGARPEVRHKRLLPGHGSAPEVYFVSTAAAAAGHASRLSLGPKLALCFLTCSLAPWVQVNLPLSLAQGWTS